MAKIIHIIEISDSDSGNVDIRVRALDESGREVSPHAATENSPAVGMAARAVLGMFSMTPEGRKQIRESGRDVAIDLAKDLVGIASTKSDDDAYPMGPLVNAFVDGVVSGVKSVEAE
jgi:hypothetical protein